MSEVTQEVMKKAAQFGIAITGDDADHIAWSHTGYPCFWPRRDKTPLQNFQKQLYDFFKHARVVGLRKAMQTP